MATEKSISQLEVEVEEAKRRRDAAYAEYEEAEHTAANAKKRLGSLAQQYFDESHAYRTAVRARNAARDNQ